MIETYLGDGVYATFDGFHIVLDLRAQDTFTKIALDLDVFDKLVEFEKQCTRRSVTGEVPDVGPDAQSR